MTVLAVRNGVFYPMHRVADDRFSGAKLDDAVVDFLATEFKKCGVRMHDLR